MKALWDMIEPEYEVQADFRHRQTRQIRRRVPVATATTCAMAESKAWGAKLKNRKKKWNITETYIERRV